MNDVNLRSVDLNLLVVLHALLEERHVTRAARRLALSQPATSNALERCRHVFKDRLLERVGGEMQLTAKAQAMREPLGRILAEIAAVVTPQARTLSQIHQTVRLTMADQPGITVLQALLPVLELTAPHVDIVLQPWHGAARALRSLESGEVDIAISLFPGLSSAFQRVSVAPQHYVVAMRTEHPAVRKFNLSTWLDFPHIVVSGAGDKAGILEDILAHQGLKRRVGLVVPSFLMVEPLLYVSELVAMVPVSCLQDPSRLAIFEPPLPVPDFTLHLAWHARRGRDPVVQHVIQAITRALAGPPPSQ